MADEKKKRKFSEYLKEKFGGDPLFHETEVQANRLGCIVLFNSGLILGIMLLLMVTGIFPLPEDLIVTPAIYALVEITVLLVISRLVKNDAWWLKYLMVIAMTFVYARLDSILTHKAAILMVIPVVFSSRYFSRRLTIVTSILCIGCFALSAAYGATRGLIDLNIVTMDKGTVMTATGGFLGAAVGNAGALNQQAFNDMLVKNTLMYNYLPKFLMFSVVSVISCNIAKRGRDMVITQHDKDVKSARIESELSVATRIQAAMLPSTFPAFPNRSDFDVYATMTPAKEVGGDFYDFFMIDHRHLGIVIADVSGKGVPAALFMMASKILIKNYAMTGMDPKDVLEAVNEQICSNNREEMFVTVWLGVLDLETGLLSASNAGHEYPVFKKPDGVFEVIKDKHGFVIGGMAGVKYSQYEIQFEPGAKLFIYTDGVAEATNAGHELFGLDRIAEALNANRDGTPQDVLESVGRSVEEFVAGEPQFDDLTMLCLEYKGKGGSEMDSKEMTVEATVENIPAVTDFVNAELEALGCSMKTQMQIDIAIDELFGNIAHYAYDPSVGPATVRVEVDDDPLSVVITFIDHGKPYDPLSRTDPDVTLSAEEREIGGLGVFLVKKTMDDVSYEYRNGQNILKIKKTI